MISQVEDKISSNHQFIGKNDSSNQSILLSARKLLGKTN